MSLKRKLAADDDDHGHSTAATAAAPASSSSPSSSVQPQQSPASVTAKRPRRHNHSPAPTQPVVPSSSHAALQRPGDARPRASSAPCSSRHHHHRPQANRPIAPLLRVPANPSEKVIYPSWSPDVTRDSLRSLDLDVLQLNIQFRHDFVLEGPHKFTRVLGKPKREDSTRYWLAVLIELETGCTCVAFDEHNKVWPCVCPDIKQPASGVRASASPPPIGAAPQIAGKMPSRVLPMLVELRSLLRHVTSPATASAADFPLRSTPPTDHAQANDMLASLLDEPRILDEVRHGVYDHVPLFRFIGQLLKEHCAPMRDARIDNMVTFACDGPPVDPSNPPSAAAWKSHVLQAIRMCFEILELMAMDIANHQLLTHRPRLMATTASMELVAFTNKFSKFALHDSPTLQVSCVQAMLQRSLDTVKQGPGTWEQHLRASLVRTVVDLIFDPTVLGGPRSPGLRIPPHFPETFYLDHSRLCRFGMEAADLTVVYMILLLAGSSVANSDELKMEITSLAPPRLGLCFGHALRSSTRSSRHGHSKSPSDSSRAGKDWDEWRQGMSDILLQVARRKAADGIPSQTAIDTLERWAEANLLEGSAFSGVIQRRLKDSLCTAILHALENPAATTAASVLPAPAYSEQPCAYSLLHPPTRASTLSSTSASRLPPPIQPLPTGTLGSGMDILAPELHSLGRRVAEVLSHHLAVYTPLYLSPGFLH